MTAAEAVALHEVVHQLLEQQTTLLASANVDLQQIDGLSAEITRLLAQVPPAQALQGFDDALRARLLTASQRTETALTAGREALERHHLQHMATHARAERDGAALRHYLPPADNEPARYFDERR